MADSLVSRTVSRSETVPSLAEVQGVQAVTGIPARVVSEDVPVGEQPLAMSSIEAGISAERITFTDANVSMSFLQATAERVEFDPASNCALEITYPGSSKSVRIELDFPSAEARHAFICEFSELSPSATALTASELKQVLLMAESHTGSAAKVGQLSGASEIAEAYQRWSDRGNLPREFSPLRPRIMKYPGSGDLEAGGVEFFDVENPDDSTYEALSSRYGVPRELVRNCGQLNCLERVSALGDFLMVSTPVLVQDKENPLKLRFEEVQTFMGKDFCVTLHAGCSDQVAQVRQALREEGHQNNPVEVFDRLSREILRYNLDVLSDLKNHTESIRKSLATDSGSPHRFDPELEVLHSDINDAQSFLSSQAMVPQVIRAFMKQNQMELPEAQEASFGSRYQLLNTVIGNLKDEISEVEQTKENVISQQISRRGVRVDMLAAVAASLVLPPTIIIEGQKLVEAIGIGATAVVYAGCAAAAYGLLRLRRAFDRRKQ